MTIAQALRQEGRKEGEKKATLKLAKQFLINGVDRNTVKISTGLSDDELNKLENKS